MGNKEMHPRFRERIEEVLKIHREPLMEKQVRSYCKLRKAARGLEDLESSQFQDQRGSPARQCKGWAKRIQKQASDVRPDVSELKQIYTGIERLIDTLSEKLEGMHTK